MASQKDGMDFELNQEQRMLIETLTTTESGRISRN